MVEVGIIDALRTPFGRPGGSLAEIHPVDLLGEVMRSLVVRAGIPAESVDQVIAGCAEKTGEQGFNIARTAWVAAGLPTAAGATTVDTQCGSSQHAFTLASSLIASGMADVVVACGVESMSRVPMGTTFNGGPGTPIPPSFQARFAHPDQFASAETIATKWGVSRADCDDLAIQSNARASAAWAAGAFDHQVVAAGDAVCDDSIRLSTTDTLSGLKPVAGGVHTAASTSKIADGASAVLLMDVARARADGLTVKAVVRGSVLVGVDPDLMLTGPIAATRRLLDRHGWTVSDLDIVEVNEAFASVVIAWAREMGVDPARTNPNGGALAVGHPIGATGTALITKAVHELHRADKQTALVTMCCGGALGTGTLLERV